MTVGVAALNSGPEISDLDGDALVYTEGAGAVLLDQNDLMNDAATVDDADTNEFSTGHLYVQITGGYDPDEDVLAIQGSDPTNTVSTWNEAAGRLDVEFTGTFNEAAVEGLIHKITYANTDTDNLTEGERTIRFQLWDGGDGPTLMGASSDYNYVNVMVVGMNDGPEIFEIGDSANYSEGSNPVVLDQDQDGYVTDPDSSDFDGGRLEVQIFGGFEQGEDILSIQDQGGISYDEVFVTLNGDEIGQGGFNPNTGTLGIDLNANADTSTVSTLIQNIVYDNNAGDNVTDGLRSVRFTLWDGDGGSANYVSMDLSVEAVNSPPVITNLAGDAQEYLEGTGATVILDQGLPASVSDPDIGDDNFSGGTLTVQISDGFNPDNTAEDVLGIRNEGNGFNQIGVVGTRIKYGGVTFASLGTHDHVNHTLTVTLDNAVADENAVAALIHNITYQNTITTSPFEGERDIRFSLYDGDGEGGTSADYSVTVNVIPVNDAPEILNLHGDTVNFIEDSDAVMLDVFDVTHPQAVVTDEEGNFGGGTLTVQIVGGYDPTEDILSVNNEGNGARQIGFDISNAVSYDGDQIGTANFIESTGMLEISLNGTADAESVSSLIQNITYNNMDTADPSEGHRDIQFVLWDNEGASSLARDTQVTVYEINDAPVIHNLAGDTVPYEEGAAPVRIDVGMDALLTDADTTSFGGGGLEVDFDGWANVDLDNGFSVEFLSIMNEGSGAGQIGFAGFNNFGMGSVYYEGVEIGYAKANIDPTNGDAPLFVQLNDAANQEAVSSLIQSITYQNTDTLDATEGERTIRFRLSDGEGPGQEPGTEMISEAFSDWAVTTVLVQGMNDAPDIQNVANDTLTYYKNDGLLAIDQGTDALVEDVDSDDFNGGNLTIQITDSATPVDDRLDISTDVGVGISLVGNDVYYNGNNIGTYTPSADENELVVTFTSPDANEDAVSALVQSIGFENTSTLNPGSGVRHVSFTLNDGDGAVSPGIIANVDVNGNRPPEVDLGVVPDTDNVWTITEDYTSRLSLTVENVFTDPDGDQLTFEAVRVDENGDPVGDGSLPNWLFLSELGTFIARPTEPVLEPVYVDVFASDNVPGFEAAETSFSIIVSSENINHEPYLVRLDAAGNPVLDSGEPIIDPTTSFTISEHETVTNTPLISANNEKVMIKALDDDIGDNMTYSIEGGNGAGNFRIDGNTGEIILQTTGENTPTGDDNIDFETGPKAFTLNIKAVDGNGGEDVGTVTIFIQDLNDEPVPAEIPEQLVYNNTLWVYNIEDPNSSIPAQVVAFDDSDDDHLTYRALLHDGGELPSWLSFNTSANEFAGYAEGLTSGTTYTIDLFADDGVNGEIVNTFTIEIASLGSELRDALDYLDDAENGEEYDLPEEGENVEIHEVFMYAQAPTQGDPADTDMVSQPVVNTDMLEALALLDGDAFIA